MRFVPVNLLKFIVAIVLLPVLCAVLKVSQSSLHVIFSDYRSAFYTGIAVYLIIRLFVYSMEEIQQFSHQVMDELLKMCGPLKDILVSSIPIYSVIFFLIYFLINRVEPNQALLKPLFFVYGFGLAMHVVGRAAVIFEQDTQVFKPSYYMEMVIGVSLSCSLSVLLFTLVIPDLTVDWFWLHLKDTVVEYYQIIFGWIR